MKALRQLARQPIKTLGGILLVTIAVAVLCVSFSQTLAASDTARKLKETYITVALPRAQGNEVLIAADPADIPLMSQGPTAEEKREWLNSAAAAYPDIIRQDTSHGLATAYSPALSACKKSPTSQGAVLEITLTEISYVGKPYELVGSPLYPIRSELEGQGICADLVGTVDRVVGLQQGYADPTGFTARVTLCLPDMEAYEALDLAVGERYLVCGDGYTDLDRELRSEIAAFMTWYKEPDLPEWDMSTYEEFVDPDAKRVEDHTAEREGREPDYSDLPKSYKCKIGDLFHGLTEAEMLRFRSIGLRVEDKSEMPQYDAAARYTVPTIARLQGTAEDFLASDDGAMWRRAMEELDINLHSFPVLGVDGMQYVAEFAAGRASIAEGRGFTAGEMKEGAQVCVISRNFAEENGIELGDTLDMQYFIYDFENPYQTFIRDGGSTADPMPYRYFSETMDMTGVRSYTVVGFYEQESPWAAAGSEDIYHFTPNTIFVPKASVTGSMDYSAEGQFRTLVIESDQLGSFLTILAEAEMDDLLEFYDNGYNAVAETLTDFEAAAKGILPIGITVYIVVLLLFLFLFPARSGKELARMDSLGAGHGRRVGHLLASTIGILLPGTAAGTVAGLLLWQAVADALREWMGTGIAVELNGAWLWLVAVVHLVFAAALTGVMAWRMSKTVNPMHKR